MPSPRSARLRHCRTLGLLTGGIAAVTRCRARHRSNSDWCWSDCRMPISAHSLRSGFIGKLGNREFRLAKRWPCPGTRQCRRRWSTSIWYRDLNLLLHKFSPNGAKNQTESGTKLADGDCRILQLCELLASWAPQRRDGRPWRNSLSRRTHLGRLHVVSSSAPCAVDGELLSPFVEFHNSRYGWAAHNQSLPRAHLATRQIEHLSLIRDGCRGSVRTQ